ncbi:MAG: DPP IV N-terminal domain-containing protein, partial [Gloeobacteraceae cyanobacterium ES-bin-316]|nr:DPP IV N-terminal domain-containing protein [Ferruginibacter sp.]
MRHQFKYVLLISCVISQSVVAQNRGINWTADGAGFYTIKDGNIFRNDPKTDAQTVVIGKEQLTPEGSGTALKVQSFVYSSDKNKVLLFTNTAKVWRYNTRGDYWVLTPVGSKLKQLGKGLAAQSLMFAKFSPDSRFVAYV